MRRMSHTYKAVITADPILLYDGLKIGDEAYYTCDLRKADNLSRQLRCAGISGRTVLVPHS